MILNGASVYCEGLELDTKSTDQLKQMVNSLREVSPSAEVSFKLLKDGDFFEALLWGRAIDSPIGIYQRGLSLDRVLGSLHKKVTVECLKIWKKKGQIIRRNFSANRQTVLAEAG